MKSLDKTFKYCVVLVSKGGLQDFIIKYSDFTSIIQCQGFQFERPMAHRLKSCSARP